MNFAPLWTPLIALQNQALCKNLAYAFVNLVGQSGLH